MQYTKLSVIVPAYNEEDTIAEILTRISQVDLPLEIETIVVDDCSTDHTRQILEGMTGVRCVYNDRNLGKGGAVRKGFEAASGEIVIIQDADLEYYPSDYARMIDPILRGETEVVLGVRLDPVNDIRKRKPIYWLSWLGNKTITLLTNVLYGNNAMEYEGCYKAFTKHLVDAVDLRSNGFELDNELVCKIMRRGYGTVDVPIRYSPRDYSHGKKIRWYDGFRILWIIVMCRFRD